MGRRKPRIRWNKWGTLVREAISEGTLKKLVSLGKPAVEENTDSHRKEKAESRNRDASAAAFASTASSEG